MKSVNGGWFFQPCSLPERAACGALALLAIVLTALLFACAYWLESRGHAA